MPSSPWVEQVAAAWHNRYFDYPWTSERADGISRALALAAAEEVLTMLLNAGWRPPPEGR